MLYIKTLFGDRFTQHPVALNCVIECRQVNNCEPNGDTHILAAGGWETRPLNQAGLARL